MTDAALSETIAVPATAAAEPPLRPARRSDIGLIHEKLMEAIRSSPYYSDEFKAYETGRLSIDWLEALVAADPFHVAVMQWKGETAGFMISGPDLGTLWLYWSYVFPEKRKTGMALVAMRTFLAHWDNGRFHKVATYTKDGNAAAEGIMKRFGWTLTARLEQHIFGEDYLLYEHKLNKTVPGYDRGAPLSRRAQIRRLFRRLVSFRF